ncbi:MAG: glycoside hydrolase family 3 C-terminal domain-containing protein [Clostridiales bacterium]|jgi:beta-glucosidase|nr:glycoside hydrolase family 3 C-terminal domain-containing protein [Clostridiales bacterium]
MAKKAIEVMLGRMTLQEKIGLLAGYDHWYLNGVERLHIPRIMTSDGPHGLRVTAGGAGGFGKGQPAVCFPSSCLLAATFDAPLLEEVGDCLGQECRALGVQVLLGPAVNLKRSPLCGRNFEFMSEDPYLTGKLAAAYIRGVQKNGVAAALKHYALNNQETNRTRVSARVSERALRELYLRHFEIAVKEADPWTVMAAYNRVNGKPMTGNARLLNRILRKEWGYKGLVMSDWGATGDRVPALKAGLDLEMPGLAARVTERDLIEAVRSGALKERTVNRAAARVLALIEKTVQPKTEGYGAALHHAAAVRAAEGGIVLLKNEGILPLEGGKRYAFIGAFAAAPPYQGGGSSHVAAYRVDSTLDCARDFADITTAEGYRLSGEPDDGLLAEAAAAASGAAACIVFLGLPPAVESEAYDRDDMRLPQNQLDLLDGIAAVCDNVLVVLHNGSPVELPFLPKIKGLVEAYLAGEGVGRAVANVLFGRTNPSGRLPETFPVRLEDNPSYLNFPGGDEVRYDEGVFVGYRYYTSKRVATAFPFGFGLSYTQFAYDGLVCGAESLSAGQTLNVAVRVTNVGARAGAEVVQLYVSPHNTAKMSRPIRELKGFSKVFLQPGESRTVEFCLCQEDFAYYDGAAGGWRVQEEESDVQICGDSQTVLLSAAVRLLAAHGAVSAVTSDTTIGELYAVPSTREFAQWAVDTMSARMLRGNLTGGAEEAHNKFWRNIIFSWPIRLFYTTGVLPSEKYAGILRELNQAIKDTRA